jgi:hypothetical protein
LHPALRKPSGRGELSADVLFKKLFRLSPELELFIGGGPEIARFQRFG